MGPVTCELPPASLLVILTTNDSRELPPAFLRRCLSFTLSEPTVDDLVAIANAHLGRRDHNLAGDKLAKIAERVVAIREEEKRAGRRPPSTAEFLDAVVAVADLNVAVVGRVWDAIEPQPYARPPLVFEPTLRGASVGLADLARAYLCLRPHNRATAEAVAPWAWVRCLRLPEWHLPWRP